MLKSLEIVNKVLEEKENECYKAYGIFLEKQIKELRQIKADLEVLEILKKYVYYIDHTIKSKPISKSVYNFDYEKLKQWLEENENDN